MKKILIKFALPATVLGIIIGAVLFYFFGTNVEVDAKENITGLKWGMDKMTVDSTLVTYGYQNMSDGASGLSKFYVENFEGIKGANGYIILSYDKRGKLDYILCNFSAEPMSGTSPETTKGRIIDAMFEAYTEAFTEDMVKTITKEEYCEAMGMALSDISEEIYRTWIGKESLITLTGDESERLLLVFEDITSDIPKEVVKKFK